MGLKANHLKLYKEIIAVCSQIHTKHVNIVWTERTVVEFKLVVVHIVTSSLYKVIYKELYTFSPTVQ